MIISTETLNTLFNGFNSKFMEGFGQAATLKEALAMMASSGTETEEYGWLGHVPGLQPWVGERIIRGLQQHGYRLRNEVFESTISVPRDKIADDHHGVYGPLFTELGMAAAAHPDELLFKVLAAGFDSKCYDGQYFFATDHPLYNAEGGIIGQISNSGGGNATAWYLLDLSRAIKPLLFQEREAYVLTRMDDPTDENVFMRREYLYGVDGRCNAGYGLWQFAYGSKQTLNSTNYEAAREAMQAIKSDVGRPMGVKPTHLVVPPSLEKEALTLLRAERLQNGATNIWRNSAELVVTQWAA